jgi:ABC-type sugar transport system permease subunit
LALGPAGGSRSLFSGRASASGCFLAPALIFFIGYQVWPIVRVLWMSFTDFQLLSDKPAQWVWVRQLRAGASTTR